MQAICLGILYFCTSVKDCSTVRELNTVFELCFNTTTKQAEYVRYRQPFDENHCSSKFLSQIPENTHSYDSLARDKTYIFAQLVPRDDFGCCTNIMGNAVPMLFDFAIGEWTITDLMLRDNYKGKIIIKSGKYTGRKTKYDVDIPDGFYYIVLDNDGNVIYNEYIDQFTGELSKELPSFIKESTPNTNTNNTLYITVSIFMILIVTLILSAIIYSIYSKLNTHNDNSSSINDVQDVSVE